MHILVAEDNEDQSLQINQALVEAGFTVSSAADGEEALFLGQTVHYDAVVLDVGLPIMDGLYVLRKWRNANLSMPVLILSTRDDEHDRLAGWAAGCEAYISKPFIMWELIANLRALIRQAAGQSGPNLQCGDLVIDMERQCLIKNQVSISLRPKPYQLIEYLILHQGSVISKDTLLDHLYGWDNHPETNTIEVFIRDIRKKIGNGYIVTRRGFGYSIKSHDEQKSGST